MQHLIGQIFSPAALAVPALTDCTAVFQARHPIASLSAGDLANRQRLCDDIQSEDTHQAFLTQSNEIHRARLLAAKDPHSGSWLKAVPISRLGLHLDDETLRISAALRVGAPVCEPHACRCGRLVDRLGHHGLSCRYSAGRLPRHANINDVVKRALTAAGIPSWLVVGDLRGVAYMRHNTSLTTIDS